MIGHQAIGVDLEAGLLACRGQWFEKFLAIDIIQEDLFPPIPTLMMW